MMAPSTPSFWLRSLTLVAFTLPPVASVAAVWGWRTDWSFSLRLSRPVTATILPIPEGVALEPRHGWCEEHGVHECAMCHPEMAQLTQPRVSQADRDRAARALALRSRPSNQPASRRHLRGLRYANDDDVTRAGIDIGVAWTGAMIESLPAPGELAFDPARITRYSARAGGLLWRVEKPVGAAVRPGELLALVDAPEIGKAKADLLLALVQVKLKGRALDDLKGATFAGSARLRDAETAFREAEIRLGATEQALTSHGLPVRAAELKSLSAEVAANRLQFACVPETISRSLDPRTTTNNLLPIIAGRAGVVIAGDSVAGEQIEANKPFLTVADASSLQLTLHVGAVDAPLMKLGLPVRFRPDDGSPEAPTTVTWIGTMADERTRAVPVRAEVPNPQGKLRASTLGLASIVIRDEAATVVVPRDCVQTDGQSWFVFVRDQFYLNDAGPKLFHPRSVRVGAMDADKAEILVGVLPGEVVVTKGAGMLLKELLKTEISAKPAPGTGGVR